ncbi:cell division ATP-binding protein FtsE [Vagococcus sp.]|uniref:cell division ATP-binding protein FtsE n=1 Tax=Vagococcus sp. TaxID=1933889 RepID=UPI003F9EA399
MIRFINAFKTYNEEKWALKRVNCEIKQGEFVYLIGESGAGKSTFLKLLTYEEKISRGQLMIGNVDLTNIKKEQVPFLRRQLGIVTQELYLLEHLTILENILYVLRATGASHKTMKARAIEALEKVDLVGFKKKKPFELSAGQRQKVIIARAIVNEPKIILADEPTGNLDDKSAVEILRLFFRLNQQGTTVIMSTHHSTLVNTVKHRVLEMKHGELIRDQLEGSYGLETDGRDIFYL